MNPSIQSSPPASLYGRVSTNLQETGSQELRAKEYLAWKKLPLGPDAEFYDDDVSGSIPIWSRPGGAKLRQRLLAGDIRHLVIVKLDRLGRSAVDLLQTVQFLDSVGVSLHIVDCGGDSLSTQGPSGRLMLTVLAGMAEYERELIRSRINSKFDAKRSRGELIGTVPFGWYAVETGELTPKGVKVRRLVDNPEEQRWIFHMHNNRCAGWGYHRIAQDLNARGIPTKRGQGEIMRLRCERSADQKEQSETRFTAGRWRAGNVRKVLINKTVQAWLATKTAQLAA